MTTNLNPRRRRRRKARSHRRRRRNPVSSLVALNPRKRRRKGRKARRRGRRRGNPIRLFNPFGGAIVGKLVGRVKTAISPRTLGQAAGGSVGFVASWAAPAYLVPQWDTGLQGIGLSAASAVLASIAVGIVAPAYGPVVLLGGLIGTVAKGLMQYARGVLFPQSGMAGFLTVTNGRMGQIPANLIAGTGRMGEFLEVRRPVSAIGPGSAAAFGAAGRYSNAS